MVLLGKVGGFGGQTWKMTLSKWILEKWILVSFAQLNKIVEFKRRYLGEHMFHSVFWFEPTCAAENKQTSFGHSRASQSGPRNQTPLEPTRL